MGLPLITVGWVVSQDPDQGAVGVVLRTTGQGTAYPVKIGYYGPADALRIRQEALPGRGTMGLVAFPYGDTRNGVWICSLLQSGLDAITSSVSGTGQVPGADAFIDYTSHYSGFWSQLNASGFYSAQFPDGSYLSAASSLTSGAPTLLPVFRHIVSGNQQRSRAPYPMADRIPVTPSPFNFGFMHKSGTYGTIYSSGATTLNVAGNVNINVASGSSLTIAISGGATFLMDAAGNVKVTLPGATTFQVDGNSNSLALAEKIASAINGHKHTGVQSGGSITGGPVSSWSASDFASDKAKAGS